MQYSHFKVCVFSDMLITRDFIEQFSKYWIELFRYFVQLLLQGLRHVRPFVYIAVLRLTQHTRYVQDVQHLRYAACLTLQKDGVNVI